MRAKNGEEAPTRDYAPDIGWKRTLRVLIRRRLITHTQRCDQVYLVALCSGERVKMEPDLSKLARLESAAGD